MERYSHLRVIGEGSFGRALLVQCKNTQENYVLKEIQLPKNQFKLDMSRREAVLLSKMKHPNIVAFREAFEADGLLCIVMEHCSGGDLLRRIQLQKNTQFCVENILKWFAQMCAGAQHIHNKRVLHRDLKSKNIFLTDDGSVKLGDFGSACVLNSSKAYAQAYVGTPYYVAPEIWDNKPYNNKSDVWSLGCVLYELCTLRHPGPSPFVSCVQFQASSWKSLILKSTETEQERRRLGRWSREEGRKVAHFLGEKSLMKASTTEGVDLPRSSYESPEPEPRKQWGCEPPDGVLQMLASASLISSDSLASAQQTGSVQGSVSDDPEERRQRKRWERAPPERLLSLLEKAQLNRAFSTFLIHRGDNNPLMGPLSQAQGDDTDGPEPGVAEDEDRLQPRSDDEDTDFEEESFCDWMDEIEKMFLEH
ncbi:serine/threonine-protein kinase Nek3 isoform X3 [Kryptolebias marmoratus]|uniref:serine/threonine-protein kinase Nek3 isoform X3 n=1 Tax=Kryptolebias marmoratus TaxID=37003 RepID=UPI000D52F321|nr:serine/threonine-protein kinase Nek3 isoform X3 [Kryptolebias marmoratus]